MKTIATIALAILAPLATAQIWGPSVAPTIIDIRPANVSYVDENGDEVPADTRYDSEAGMYVSEVPEGAIVCVTYSINATDPMSAKLNFGGGSFAWMTLQEASFFTRWFTNKQSFKARFRAVDGDESGSISLSVTPVDAADTSKELKPTPSFSIILT